jgi:hypothetical protein
MARVSQIGFWHYGTQYIRYIFSTGLAKEKFGDFLAKIKKNVTALTQRFGCEQRIFSD